MKKKVLLLQYTLLPLKTQGRKSRKSAYTLAPENARKKIQKIPHSA